jgi:Zn-dependent alcohol dehydrogenase
MVSAVPKLNIPRYIDLCQGGTSSADVLLSRSSRLNDINVGFYRLAAGTVSRAGTHHVPT